MSKKIRIVLFLIGISLFSALIYRIGISEIIKVISGAKIHFVFLGVLVYLMVIFTRSLKWFLLIRLIDKKIKYKEFTPFYLVNSLIGNLTPFKSGEAITPLLFRKYLKIPFGQGFSIVVLDRVFELLIFVVILISALFYVLNLDIQDSLILSVGRVALIFLPLLTVFLIVLMKSKRITLKIVRSFRFLKFIEKELDIFYNTLPLFSKTYQFLVPLTLISWFFEISASYLIYTSIFSVSFIAVTTAQIITTGANLATFIPGGIGITEVSIVYILGLFGYSFTLVTSGALLARFLLSTILLGSGLIGFLMIKKGNA